MRWKVYWQKVFSESNGTPSNKRMIATYAALVYSIVLMSAFFFTIPINDAVMHMADVFFGTAIGNYVVGRFSEKGNPSKEEPDGLDDSPNTPKKL